MIEPLIFDIETGPMPDDELETVKPEFKARANLRDPAKIAEDLAQKEVEWRDKAALSALTGRVVCVGFADGDEVEFWGNRNEPERDIVAATFARIDRAILRNQKVAGHNIVGFDLPFLRRRAWKLDVPMPKMVTENDWRRSPHLIDTMDLWSCNVYGDRISLDNLGRHFGLQPKTHSGAEFASLWDSDREAALAYLEYDLWLTQRVYERLTARPAPLIT